MLEKEPTIIFRYKGNVKLQSLFSAARALREVHPDLSPESFSLDANEKVIKVYGGNAKALQDLIKRIQGSDTYRKLEKIERRLSPEDNSENNNFDEAVSYILTSVAETELNELIANTPKVDPSMIRY